MDRSNKALGFALALSFVAVACAAPTIPESGLGEDPSQSAATKKPSTATTPPKKDNSAPPADPANPAPTDPANPAPTDPTPTSCAAKATFDECFQCCDAPTGGALKAADDAFGQCACGGGQCTSACGATFCAGQQPTAACETCLTNTCDTAADALCTTAACKSGQQCLQASACEQKP